MAPCQPWAGSSIDVVVTAESENDQFYEWRDKLPVGEQVKKLAEAWALVHGVPGTAVGFDDANGCEVDLLQTPLSLGWGVKGEVFLRAFPTEDRFMEPKSQEEKAAADAAGGGEESPAPTTAASTTAASLAPATPSAMDSTQATEDVSAPEAAEAKEAKEPKERKEAREPQEAPQPKLRSDRGRRGSRGQGERTRGRAATATSPSTGAATPPSKAASSGGRASRASSGKAGTGAASAPSLPAASESPPTEAEEIAFEQVNPKKQGSSAYERYEKYKRARTVDEAMILGAARGDIAHDFKRGFLKRRRAV